MQILLLLIFWRLFTLFIAFLSIYLIPLFEAQYPYYHRLVHLGPQLYHIWGSFDGVHYLHIAQFGYQEAYTQVFFPLYPLLINLITYLGINHYTAGIIINHLALYGALIFIYKLCLSRNLTHSIAIQTIILILIFPTSFFLGSLYTESLYLLLSASFIYFLHHRKHLLTAALGLLATTTRFPAVFLVFPTLQQFQQTFACLRFNRQVITYTLLLFTTLLGLLGYMTYLDTSTGDPLYFAHAQSDFSSHRETDQLVLLPQVMVRYAKMFLTVPLTTPLYLILIQEFLLSLLFLALSWLILKKLNWGLALYVLANVLLPSLTGSFSSIPRYVLVLFPAFIVLSQYLSNHRLIRTAYITTSLIFLIYNLILFTRGLWVA